MSSKLDSKNKGKQYTFQDWLKNKIPYKEIFEENLIKEEVFLFNEAYYPHDLVLKGYMTNEEYQEIYEYQFKCYQIALDWYLKDEIIRLENDIEHAVDKVDFLEGLKEHYESKVQKIGGDRLREIKTGGIDEYGLTAEKCRNILNCKDTDWKNHTFGLIFWDAPHYDLKRPNVHLQQSLDYRLYLHFKRRLEKVRCSRTVKVNEKPSGGLKSQGLNKDTIYEIALNNVCRNARRKDKREILEYYLLLRKEEKKLSDKLILDMHVSRKYQVESSTFYYWLKKLDEEIKSVTTHSI